MSKIILSTVLSILLCLIGGDLFSQNKIPFGEIKYGDLDNKPYKPDPGADAIILSDQGIASLNYTGDDFFVELVRDVKIRIVNSNGFDYANVELPFSINDDMVSYRASTFNLRDGEIVETAISKKSFILDYSGKTRRVLKFSFPDVHEGSILEYSYTVRLKESAVFTLIPWYFQSDIPVVTSSITVAYPEYFIYKNILTGSATSVHSTTSLKNSYFFKEPVKVNVTTWYIQDMPAFRAEPYMKSWSEHLTGINFELASTNFPGSSFEEITPTYETLTTKLLERSDFGGCLKKAGFLSQTAVEITKGLPDNLSKLKKIHKYISEKVLWDGVEDYTASGPLSKAYRLERGNSADINMILIAMLRAVNIKADPLILSTRSNGTINQYSAMIQQFNYVLAYVYADDNFYLVDATDPQRPFNVLPVECLNGVGRLISEYDSKFIDLRNNETDATQQTLTLISDEKGNLTGELKNRYPGLNAYSLRKMIRLVGEEGYVDLMKAGSTETEISGFNLQNFELRDSDMVETVQLNIKNSTQLAGNRLLFSPFLPMVAETNSFYQEKRQFPIDFEAPVDNHVIMNLEIPGGATVIEKPANIKFNMGTNDGSYEFTCGQTGNRLTINSVLKINKTTFQPSEYALIQDFYSKIQKKQAELIVVEMNQ